MVTTGGTSLKEDILRLYGRVHVLVATPGRILDLARKGVANISSCNIMVMDEADKLLSPEFMPLVEELINFLPTTRQLLMFSATFPVTVITTLVFIFSLSFPLCLSLLSLFALN
jgi:ATP-dependent RNA helicase DDX6/DHH1